MKTSKQYEEVIVVATISETMSKTISEEKSPDETISSLTAQSANKCLENKSRRTVIRKLAVGSAALAGCSFLPDKWTAPVLEFGSLPAHATTSGEVSAAPEEVAAGTGNFSLMFVQTVMPCASCGIWFDSANLVIEHSGSTYTSSQSGSLLIKKTLGPGYFKANMSSIPASASIQSATLVMSLNVHEGISYDDFSSVIEVYDFSSGNQGGKVRTITAKDDIMGKGFSKGNPNVPIDFTAYAKKIHGR